MQGAPGVHAADAGLCRFGFLSTHGDYMPMDGDPDVMPPHQASGICSTCAIQVTVTECRWQ